MKIDLSFSQLIELIGVFVLVVSTTVGICTWFFQQWKKEILMECKAYLYVLQERIQGNEIEITHLNDYAERNMPGFRALILSIRRRDIDELR